MNLHFLDPEIDRNFNLLRRLTRVASANELDSESAFVFIYTLFDSDFEYEFSNHNMDNNRNLRQLFALDVTYNALCIEYIEVTKSLELKSSLMDLLPKFNGIEGKDPHKHLKDFHVVCYRIKPQRVRKNHIKMRAFSFSL